MVDTSYTAWGSAGVNPPESMPNEGSGGFQTIRKCFFGGFHNKVWDRLASVVLRTDSFQSLCTASISVTSSRS